MRSRAAIASILASTAVLVGGWELGSAGTTASAPTATPSAADSSPTTASSPATASTPATPAAEATAPTASAPSADAPADTSADGTYTGATESTRYGDVQVQITVSGGAITDVTALQLTDEDGRSVAISNRAAPILRGEVLAAQSAQVDSVSGATYTSDAYLSSLQSAIDQAGL